MTITYEQAGQLIKRGRGNCKKIENNTYLHPLENGDYAIELHGHPIIIIHANGSYTLNSCGWRTVTTKDRLNRFTPARVYQTKGQWYVAGNVMFADGMIVGSDGKVLRLPESAATAEQARIDMKNRIKVYVDGYAKHCLEQGMLTPPDNGCCLMCRFGDISGKDHILSHFDEPYYVPSLLVNAIKQQAPAGLPLWWSILEREIVAGNANQLKRFLRNYLNKMLNELVEQAACFTVAQS